MFKYFFKLITPVLRLVLLLMTSLRTFYWLICLTKLNNICFGYRERITNLAHLVLVSETYVFSIFFETANLQNFIILKQLTWKENQKDLCWKALVCVQKISLIICIMMYLLCHWLWHNILMKFWNRLM